jgi:phosphatidylserine/phosphatidylglycerophosphate/cardiolipin synthase-like enzyme
LKTFEFSNTVVSKVLAELEKAEKFIKIAVFQIHLEQLFDLIERKVANGVKIDIFTLPYDSINDSVSADVISRLKRLSNLGVHIYFCKWNVGDPERTSTAIGRWYSFHGKFIVTDKSAIALSANFTRSNELDAAIIIENEEPFIKIFLDRFDELLSRFVTQKDGYDGDIRYNIINSGINNIGKVFELPEIIQTTTHKDHWITQYPSPFCPDDIKIEDNLYISPFNIKGRNIYEKILREAEEFIFISAESFTDVDFGLFLRQLKKEKQITICLLTGFKSMDFTDRIQKMYRELIANDINLYTIETDLHAKLIITDKHLLIGSINLNKMNLGFNITKRYWRENTETLFVTSDANIIRDAKGKYEHQITNSINMETKLAENIEKDVSNLLNKSYKIRVKREVRKLLSKFVLMKEIEVKRDTNKLVKIAVKLMQHYKVRIANIDTFIMAVILFYLQDRKHTYSEIGNKLNKLVTVNNLRTLIEMLKNSEFIEINEEYYELNIDKLFE